MKRMSKSCTAAAAACRGCEAKEVYLSVSCLWLSGHPAACSIIV